MDEAILHSAEPWTVEFMRNIMGIFFIVFSFFQILGYKSFVSMFSDYDLIAKYIHTYAYIYPFIGIALGVLYLLDLFSPWRDVVTAIITLVGAYGVWRTLRVQKGKVHCACFGHIIKLPLSTLTLAEDLLMGTMATVIVVLYIL